MKNVVVFDLDGTLSLPEHRLHHIKGDKPDWNAFFADCGGDAPNSPVIEMNRALSNEGKYNLLILSGRSDIVEKITERWLHRYGVMFHDLVMRPDGDYTPDDDLKFNMLNNWLAINGKTPKDILCIFDDRDKVVKMWRKHGYTCFQVAPGEF